MKLSRLFVTLLLFLACVALVLLAQAQGGNEPNKCHTDWDFCNSGTEAENAYYWRLGWCAAAIERGAVSASPSACMGQEEGTVSFPSSSPARAQRSAPARARLEGTQEPLPPPPPPPPPSPLPDGNACHDWGDLCNSGSEAENEYHWRLGWCVWAVKTGAVSDSVSACMGEPEGTVSHPPWSPHPDGGPPSQPNPEGTPEPSPPNPGDPPSPPNPGGNPPSPPNPPSNPGGEPSQPSIPVGLICLERHSSGRCSLIGTPPIPAHLNWAEHGWRCSGRRAVFNNRGQLVWHLCTRWDYQRPNRPEPEGTQES